MGKETVGHKVVLTEARLKAPPSDQLIRYTHAPRLVREKKRFDQFMKVDMAHTVMLVERKILSRRDGGKILKRLRELDALGPGKFRTDPKKGSGYHQGSHRFSPKSDSFDGRGFSQCENHQGNTPKQSQKHSEEIMWIRICNQ